MSKKLVSGASMEADNSSSDSSDESDSQEFELQEKAKKLENDLADNKYLYDTHAELVAIYKKLGDLKSFRAAFQRFHKFFPLTFSLWVDWINVEKSLASGQQHLENVSKLFDKAVEDYLSVDLWMEYIQWTLGHSDLEKTRAVVEKALNSAGLVCDKGYLIWDMLREIEAAHMALKDSESEEWKKQVLKLADVFKRELSVPSLNLEDTYEEWKAWIETLPEGLVDSKPVEYGYQKAKKALEAYKPFEDQLLVAETNEKLFQTYKDYIGVVTDPSTVISLYERGAVHLCLVPEFWIDYCSYVFKLGHQALFVCKKALRNCPWSEDLWIFKMRALENLKKNESEVLECFEQGIASISPCPGLDLWMSYIEYTHRCVASTEKLDKLFEQGIEQLGFDHDPQCKVSRLYGRILAHRGDLKGARKIWGRILSNPEIKGSSMMWLEFANLEKQYGEHSTLRNVYHRAIKAVKDLPHSIAEDWLMFERHFGTLDEVMKCVQICREVHVGLSQAQTWPPQNEDDKLGKGKKRKFETEPEKADDHKRHKKEREEKPRVVQTERKPPVDKNPETTVFISNLHPSVTDAKLRSMFPNCVNLEIALDRKGKSRCFGYAQFKTPEEVSVALARDREPLDGRPVFISEIKVDKTEKKTVFKYPTNEEKNKLFVRGLPINKTKEQIDELFKKYGAKDVRLVLHKSGQPKGLAYIEFENERQTQEALKQTDQMTVDGHVITVAISAPPPKKDRGQKDFFGGKRDEEPLRHARSRLQTSLLPRSLQIKSEASKETKNGGEASTMKSNSDFRAMLLK